MPAEKIVTFPSQKSPTPRHKKRDDGRYRTKAYYQDPLTGARKEKYFYGDTFSEADKKKRDFLRQLETGISPDAFSITVSEYVEKWLQLRAKKDAGRKTSRNYNTHAREAARLTSAFGKKQLRHITQSDLQSILLSRQGMSKKAINSTYTTLHQIFLAALGDRLISFDPMATLEKPSGTAGSHRALEEWEKSLILSHWPSHRGGLFAIIMLLTGLRRGELCALSWENVDLDARTITVTESISDNNGTPVRGKPKTEASVRVLPILPPLLPILQQHARPSGPVCPGLHGEYMSASASDSLWSSFRYHLAVILCGVPKSSVTRCNLKAIKDHPDLYSEKNPKYVWKDLTFRMHDLRHTFCTMLYDADVDVKTAQLLMGHSSVDVTMRIYTHLSQQRKLASIDHLAAVSSSWASPASAQPSPSADTPAHTPF